MGEQGLVDVAGELYALPFDEFVGARTAAAKEHPSLAADVRSLPKPSVAAWTVNMLAVRRPETLRELAGLGVSMRAAQSGLDAQELRRLGHERRQLLGSAVDAAREIATQQGRKISSTIAAEVEATLRAATADEGAAAAVQSGRLLRGLSADGVDVVDLSGAVALPESLPAAAEAAAPRGSGKAAQAGAGAKAGGTGAGTRAGTAVGQPRLRAVRQEPRRSAPSALVRARSLLKEAEEAAASADREAREHEAELAEATGLATGLTDTVQTLREELARCEQELKAARKRRELAAARAQQAARAASRARRGEDLARERVLRLGNTPD